METGATGQSKRQKPYGFSKKLLKLTIWGAVVFWLTTIATSLLPVAADYRAAYSNWSMQTVWVGSLPMGMIFGCCVSFFLLLFFEKIPTTNTIIKSVILSSFLLVIVILLIDLPMSSHALKNSLYYFLIGVIFNVLRFSVLGIVIGYLHIRLRRPDKG